MECNLTTDCVWGLGRFYSAAADKNLGLVILGGLLGGLLQPVVAKFTPRADNPPSASYWQSPLLGVAAAGISVYVVADTKTEDAIHLLFFALLCGLAFPAVLSQAIGNVSKNTAALQSNLGKIADAAKSDDLQENAQAAEKLRTTLASNPLTTVKPENQQAIETAAQLVVANIASTTANTAEEQMKIVGELQDVGAVARAAGWDQTAQATADELKKLSESVSDDGAKAVAVQAADRLSNPGCA